MEQALSCSKIIGAEVNSMSVSGLNLTVGIGTSVHIYDLRYFDKPVASTEPHKGTQIRCVSSIPHTKGMITFLVQFISFQTGNNELLVLL